MIGASPAFLELQGRLAKVARYREPVLIAGESGVGKESLAEAIYLLGEAKPRPYISVNCPQYQDSNLTVSELFGHVKGSFTGAVGDHRGAFEEADGGVIFLDEIGDLPANVQAMLLRALATGEFRPLGGSRAVRSDVRVISATNRPLNQLVMTNQFRYDLFSRLARFQLVVPPLRERGDDWLLLVEHSLARLHAKYGVRKHMSADALRVLQNQAWPGNVRQLISVVTTGFAMSDGATIEPEDFSTAIERDASALVEPNADSPDALYHRFIRRALSPVDPARRVVLVDRLRAVHGSASESFAGEGSDPQRARRSAQLPERRGVVRHARQRLPALHGLSEASRFEALTSEFP